MEEAHQLERSWQSKTKLSGHQEEQIWFACDSDWST